MSVDECRIKSFLVSHIYTLSIELANNVRFWNLLKTFYIEKEEFKTILKIVNTLVKKIIT